MASCKFTNNCWSTLASGITASATSITVAAGQGARFPTLSGGDYCYATLQNAAGTVEVVKVTAIATDTLTVVRAQDGTTGTAYLTGDRIELRWPNAAILAVKTDAVNAAFAAKGDILIGTGAAAYAALAVGTNGKTLIADSAQASGVKWIGAPKLITSSRLPTAASGSVAYTGVGFKPRTLIGFGGDGSTNVSFNGFCDSALAQACLFDGTTGAVGNWSTAFIQIGIAAANQSGTVTSLDTDGFTISWVRNAAPGGGAINFAVLCFP